MDCLQRTFRGVAMAAVLAVSSACAMSPAGPVRQDVSDVLVPFDPAGPGAVVSVARGDTILYSAARGMASVPLGAPLTTRSSLRIGSITKSMTAAAILVLRDRGMLTLDAPLSTWLPDFPRAADITLAQLLSHTAGVSDAWDAPLTDDFDNARRVALIASKPLDFEPGTDWRYSNSGYMLLGAVLEKITGTSWDAAVHVLVAAPLGMNDTAYRSDASVVPRLADGYTVDAKGKLARPLLYSIGGPAASGGLTSTVDDVSRFVRGMAHGALVSSATFASMTRPARIGTVEVPYGEGFMLGEVRGEPAVEHNGVIDGYSAHFVYLPRRDITVVVLENSDSGIIGARSLAHRLTAVALGRPYRTFVDTAPDAASLASLAGTYSFDGGSHVLTVAGDRLQVQRDGGPPKRLVLARGDVLYYAGDGIDYFQVVRDPDGKVTALGFHADGEDASRLETRVAPTSAIMGR